MLTADCTRQSSTRFRGSMRHGVVLDTEQTGSRGAGRVAPSMVIRPALTSSSAARPRVSAGASGEAAAQGAGPVRPLRPRAARGRSCGGRGGGGGAGRGLVAVAAGLLAGQLGLPEGGEPLRPDLAPGPQRRGHAGRGTPTSLRPASCCAVAVAGLRRPPAEVAARAGHSVRVLLTIYAHCIPGCDQIASQHIEEALNPSHWPPAGPQEPAQTPGIPSVMRPCHSWAQRDTAGPGASTQIRLNIPDLRKYRSERSAPPVTARDRRPRAPIRSEPLTSQNRAHHWPAATGNGLPNRSRTRIRPGLREHRHRV